MNPTSLAVCIGTSAVLGVMGSSVALGLGNQDNSALTAYRSGHYEEAIGAFQQKIRSGQDIPHDHLHLFRALFEVGRYMEAEEVARGFLSLKHL